MRFRDTITVVRAGSSPAPDGGDQIPDWGAATTVNYPGELQPLSTDELVVAAERTDSTHKVFLPADADVKSTDRILHLGLYYEIEGQPEHYRARGRDHHIELRTFRITGG